VGLKKEMELERAFVKREAYCSQAPTRLAMRGCGGLSARSRTA
jgi:hypothetical protein